MALPRAQSRADVKVGGLGVCHPRDRCAFCGTRYGVLDLQVIVTTHAWGYVCRDVAGCCRRRSRKGQLRLFGGGSS